MAALHIVIKRQFLHLYLHLAKVCGRTDYIAFELLCLFLLRLGRGAEYCDQFVCLCVSICPRAYL